MHEQTVRAKLSSKFSCLKVPGIKVSNYILINEYYFLKRVMFNKDNFLNWPIFRKLNHFLLQREILLKNTDLHATFGIILHLIK